MYSFKGSDLLKIEKINDHQIRCTLTRADLMERKIKLSELAYGTEKAKELFQDMMQQAHREFGFEADNIPLMIEAIPLNNESIVLIITKVEDPEELDTRFSKFSNPEKDSAAPEQTPSVGGADEIIDLFQKLLEARKKGQQQANAKMTENQTPDHAAKVSTAEADTTTEQSTIDLIRTLTFHSLDEVIAASHALGASYDGANTLYKDQKQAVYHLVLHQSGSSPEEFNRVCNLLSEFGQSAPLSAAGEFHFAEHFEVICADTALQQLVAL